MGVSARKIQYNVRVLEISNRNGHGHHDNLRPHAFT